MLSSYLYVSRSNLQISTCEKDVSGIVELAQQKNAALGITGAIIFSGRYFAQILEGHSRSLEELMVSILGDPRHSDVQIISQAEISERTFGDWSMAYSGPSSYVNRHIEPLITEIVDGTERAARARRLVTLMKELTVQGC